MFVRQGARRALYLDFLAPSLLHRNATSSAIPNLQSLHHLRDRAPRTAQKRSGSLKHPARQAGQVASVKSNNKEPVPSTNAIDLFVKTASQLDAALTRNELSNARKLWATLSSQNLLRYLGIPQLQRCSSSIASAYGRNPGSGDQWSIEDKKTMRTIAIYTALQGYPEGIRAAMLHHLVSDEPDEVLKLYQTYVTSQSEDMAQELPKPIEGVPIPEDLAPPGRRTEVLLGAIAACAMKGSFSDAVRMVAESNTRISHPIVEHHIHAFPNAPAVDGYVRRLELVYLLSHPPALLKHANNLARDKATDRLETLCKSIVAAILGEESWLVVTEDQISEERPVVVPRFTWTTLITALTICKRQDLAGRLWEDMIKCGVKPDASIWTAIFDGYSTLGAWQESLATWDAMLAQGVEPEPLTYRAVIATLFKARRPDDAMIKFQEYEQNWVRKGKRHPTELADKYTSQALTLHNTVLHGLLTNSDREAQAIALFERMKTDGPKPDLISWNTMMSNYGRRGNMKMISSSLQGLKESGLTPDVFTYSTILTALLKVGREDAPQLILDMMKKDNMNPGAAVNTTIIDNLLREPDAKNIKAAFNILNRMEGERTPAERPNEVTYTTMLTGIYRWGSSREAEDHRLDILRRMDGRGTEFNRATCHILIRASLESPSREGTRYALDHFNQMIRLKIEPDFDTWYIILDGMLRRGEIRIADDLLAEMARRGFEPSGPLSGLISRIRRSRRRVVGV